MAKSEPVGQQKGESKVEHWLKEVDAAVKREEPYRKNAWEGIKLYEAENCNQTHFNILYSNTEVLLPALYSATPRPVVQRRYKDEDPAGAAVAKLGVRTLEFLVDEGAQPYTSFDNLMQKATLSGLVAGRGITRFKYDAYIVGAEEDGDDETETTDHEAEEGKVLPGTTEEELTKGGRVAWETVCGEIIPWNRIVYPYATSWCELPWLCFKHPMTAKELVDNFGALGGKIKVSALGMRDKEEEMSEDSAGPSMTASEAMRNGWQGEGPVGAWVYEIWDKVAKRVIFISPGLPDETLRDIPDPLGLEAFFPCEQPLTFFDRIDDLTPQTLYTFYRQQAEELDRISFRINRLLSALKARGMYDSTVEGFDQLMAADDNELIPAQNVAALIEGKTLENSVWFMPIDRIMQVLQGLYIQRDQCKQVIYEITGISDIVRGASVPSETLGAQQIKEQWGNMRLRRYQKRVQQYCAGCMRIMFEIAAAKFSIDTFKSMTGLNFPTAQEKAALEQQQAMQQQQALAMAAQAQQQGQEAPEMPEPEPIPPSWEEIADIAKSDLRRSYRVSIETNSTVDPEAVEDQKHISEVMNALSQLIIGSQPLLENGSLPFEAFKALLLTVVRRFRFGTELEETIRSMQAPPQKTGEAEQKAQEELDKQKKDMESKAAQQEIAAYKQQLKMEAEQAQMKMEMDFQKKVFELEQKMAREVMRLEQQAQAQKLSVMEAEANRNMQAKEAMHANQMAETMRQRESEQQGEDMGREVNHRMEDMERESAAEAEKEKE